MKCLQEAKKELLNSGATTVDVSGCGCSDCILGPLWKCDKCEETTERLQIAWGECLGEKVDILDWFCPACGHTNLTFQGTPNESTAYWDREWSGWEEGA